MPVFIRAACLIEMWVTYHFKAQQIFLGEMQHVAFLSIAIGVCVYVLLLLFL